jgi:hypothetical protein
MSQAANPAAGAVPKVRPGPFVPLWGLAADVLVIAALTVAIVGSSRFWLDFLHVFGGALWISTDLLMGFVIGPIMNRLDIPARMVFAKNLMTKMLLIMPTAVICTVAAGWQLALIDGFFGYAPRHAWVLASLIVVAILSILAYTFLEPANIIVLLELRKPEPNGLLISRMMKRFLYTAGVLGVLQLSIVIIMVRLAT